MPAYCNLLFRLRAVRPQNDCFHVPCAPRPVLEDSDTVFLAIRLLKYRLQKERNSFTSAPCTNVEVCSSSLVSRILNYASMESS